MKRIVANVAYSLKLKEIGVPQNSLFYWVDTRKSWKEYNCPAAVYPNDPVFVPFWDLEAGAVDLELLEGYGYAKGASKDYNNSEPLAAFTVSEIGEMLVEVAEENFLKAYGHIFNVPNTTFITPLGMRLCMSNPDLAARMLIYLIENNFIKLPTA